MSQKPIANSVSAPVLCISRNPNIQMYEALCELLADIAEDYGLHIICPDSDFEEPPWQHPRATYSRLAPRLNFLHVPMTLRLFASALRKAASGVPPFILGAEPVGDIIAGLVARLTGSRFVNYGLELPHMKGARMPFAVRLEHWSNRTADLIVTMDEPHRTFIAEQTGADPRRIAMLPNCTRGRPGRYESTFLRERLPECASGTIALHAGGIGEAQQSLELARSAANWPRDRHLVFHCHCRMDQEGYFRQFAAELPGIPNVHMHNSPVRREDLDLLVASADIGLAWYNRDFLGYRADLLGLAPGKIGRYLRNGIPIVVTKLPTIADYIDRYRCGICVDTVDEIGPALDTLLGDYATFSANALRCYAEIWQPEPHLEAIRQRLALLAGRTRNDT